MEYNRKKYLENKGKWVAVRYLNDLIIEKLTWSQFLKVNGKVSKYEDRATVFKKISKNKKIHDMADKMLVIINSMKEV